MNGISLHVFDFDDTHLKTVIHPAGPVVSSLLALAAHRPISGREVLTSLVADIEAVIDIARGSPKKRERGAALGRARVVQLLYSKSHPELSLPKRANAK